MGVSGVSGASGFGGRVRVRGVSSFVGAGVWGFALPARASSRYRSASSGVGKRTGGATSSRVVPPGYSTQTGSYFRPWIPRTVPLSSPVGSGTWTTIPTITSLGPSSFFSAPLGVSVLVWGGSGWRWRSWGVVGFGGGEGLRRPCGGGGWGAFWPRGSPRRHSCRTTRRKTFASWQGVRGGWVAAWLWGGGGLRRWWWKPPPLLPVPHPTPSHAPPHPLTHPPAYPTSCIRAHSPGRKWRDVNQTPLTTRAVSRSWRPRQRARPRRGSRATMRCRAPGVLLGSPQCLAGSPGWDWHASRSPGHQSPAEIKKK